MVGVSRSTPDHKLRIVTVDCDVNRKDLELIKLPKGCCVVNWQLTIHNGKNKATLWVDVSGEEAFDHDEPTMPCGWDYRRMLKVKP